MQSPLTIIPLPGGGFRVVQQVSMNSAVPRATVGFDDVASLLHHLSDELQAQEPVMDLQLAKCDLAVLADLAAVPYSVAGAVEKAFAHNQGRPTASSAQIQMTLKKLGEHARIAKRWTGS